MSKHAFVCQLTLLNIDTYSNILIESSINTNDMYSRVNEKRIYVIDRTFRINGRIHIRDGKPSWTGNSSIDGKLV